MVEKDLKHDMLYLKDQLAETLITECLKDPNYHLRGAVVQRRKDNPGMKNDSKIIKRYTFNTVDDFNYYKDEIQSYVKLFNARFYLQPSVKSYETIGLEVLNQLATLFIHRDYEAIKNMYDTIADGNTGVKSLRLWLIDADVNENTNKDWLPELIMYLYENVPQGQKLLITPTLSGYHILTVPHKRDNNKIKEIANKNKVEISYKTNSSTLIYWKELLENGL